MKFSSVLYTKLYKFDSERNHLAYVNYARVRSWNQPVLNNKDIFSYLRKHW